MKELANIELDARSTDVVVGQIVAHVVGQAGVSSIAGFGSLLGQEIESAAAGPPKGGRTSRMSTK